MNFTSEFFETADELSEAKNDAVSAQSTRRERLKQIRKFSNGLALMTEADAKRLNRKEITNHLTTYSKLLQQATMFHSMVTGTNALLQVLVDTNDPEKDLLLGQRISKIINRGALRRKGKFSKFWGTVSGEIVMAGGAPTLYPPKYGWLPEVAIDIYFPPGTKQDSDKVSYCFRPVELSYSDLKHLLASVKGEKGHVHDVNNIRVLLSALKRQIKTRTKDGASFGDEITKGARDESSLRTAVISAWYYYEVKFDDEKQTRYVSRTLFADPMQVASTEADKPQGMKLKGDDLSVARIVSHVERAYPDAEAWLHAVCIDSEIGGEKDMDSLRGMAELMYPSGADMEELLNLMLEGDRARAKPKMRATEKANASDVLKWNIETDTMVPMGVEEVPFKSSSQPLQTPFGMLERVASSITGAPMSNSGRQGELRVQQQERSEANTGIQTDRLSDAYDNLESILETVVWRLLAGDVKPGTEGYQETMWVRAQLDKEKIDYKALAEREHGQFKHLHIRAKRIIGNGDRQEQVETGDWMMTNLVNFEPASRPLILQHAFALRTGDPDLAEMAIRPPQVILNQQRITAENEFDTIARRAMIGMSVAPQPDDIHHNHIESHMVDLQALIGANDVTPWNLREALIFAAVVEHIAAHIQILLSNPATNFEGNKYLQPFQKLITDGKPLVAEAQQAQDAEVAQLSPMEQAKIELEVAKLELKAHELGVREEDLRDLRSIRAGRQTLSERAQFVREIQDRERMKLERKKVDTAAAAKKNGPDKTRTK